MKNLSQFIIAAVLAFLISQPVVAQADEVSLAEYQDLMTQYFIHLGAEDVTTQLETLTYEQWQQMYDLTPSKGNLAAAITSLLTSPQDAAAVKLMMPQAIAPSIVVSGEFEPRYPVWSDEYMTFMLTSQLLIIDTPPLGLQDDRCDEGREAVTGVIHTALHSAAIAAETLSDAALDAAEVGFAVIAGVARAADYTSEVILEGCEVHAGNVDGAEIEAAYENTRTILDETNTILDNTNALSTLFGDETNFTDDDELAAHEAAIENAMSTHDAEIKEQLTLIQDQLIQQQAQLDEIIRLLNTPQGRRPNWND